MVEVTITPGSRLFQLAQPDALVNLRNNNFIIRSLSSEDTFGENIFVQDAPRKLKINNKYYDADRDGSIDNFLKKQGVSQHHYDQLQRHYSQRLLSGIWQETVYSSLGTQGLAIVDKDNDANILIEDGCFYLDTRLHSIIFGKPFNPVANRSIDADIHTRFLLTENGFQMQEVCFSGEDALELIQLSFQPQQVKLSLDLDQTTYSTGAYGKIVTPPILTLCYWVQDVTLNSNRHEQESFTAIKGARFDDSTIEEIKQLTFYYPRELIQAQGVAVEAITLLGAEKLENFERRVIASITGNRYQESEGGFSSEVEVANEQLRQLGNSYGHKSQAFRQLPTDEVIFHLDDCQEVVDGITGDEALKHVVAIKVNPSDRDSFIAAQRQVANACGLAEFSYQLIKNREWHANPLKNLTGVRYIVEQQEYVSETAALVSEFINTRLESMDQAVQLEFFSTCFLHRLDLMAQVLSGCYSNLNDVTKGIIMDSLEYHLVSDVGSNSLAEFYNQLYPVLTVEHKFRINDFLEKNRQTIGGDSVTQCLQIAVNKKLNSLNLAGRLNMGRRMRSKTSARMHYGTYFISFCLISAVATLTGVGIIALPIGLGGLLAVCALNAIVGARQLHQDYTGKNFFPSLFAPELPYPSVADSLSIDVRVQRDAPSASLTPRGVDDIREPLLSEDLSRLGDNSPSQ